MNDNPMAPFWFSVAVGVICFFVIEWSWVVSVGVGLGVMMFLEKVGL